jgi:hypothetical protein
MKGRDRGRLRAIFGLRPLRRHVADGSIATELGLPHDVWFSPDSDRIPDMADGPVRAISGSQPA